MTQFRKKFADAKSLQFADPSKLSHTLRVVQEVGNKSVKGVSTLNNRLEFISSNTAPVTEGDRTADELLACRVMLSGSVANKAKILDAWAVMKANVDAALADGSLDGFLPNNAVFVTTV